MYYWKEYNCLAAFLDIVLIRLGIIDKAELCESTGTCWGCQFHNPEGME